MQPRQFEKMIKIITKVNLVDVVKNCINEKQTSSLMETP